MRSVVHRANGAVEVLVSGPQSHGRSRPIRRSRRSPGESHHPGLPWPRQRILSPQPTSRFVDGEATGIVQTWLGQRTYSDERCPKALIFYPCREEEKVVHVGNCLAYVTRYPNVPWLESFDGDGVWRVVVPGNRYAWDVYEGSHSVRTAWATPSTSPCR